jgi:hypothetical protein
MWFAERCSASVREREPHSENGAGSGCHVMPATGAESRTPPPTSSCLHLRLTISYPPRLKRRSASRLSSLPCHILPPWNPCAEAHSFRPRYLLTLYLTQIILSGFRCRFLAGHSQFVVHRVRSSVCRRNSIAQAFTTA